MVIAAFFILEFIVNQKHPDQVRNPEATSLLSSFHPDVFVNLGSSSVGRILDGEVWRVLASTFLHAGLLHVLMNSYVLLSLSRTCEPLLGTERYLTTYLACGLVSSLCSVAYRYWRIHPVLHARDIGAVGASGAVFGLIGVLLGFALRHRDKTLQSQIVQSIIFIVLITLFIPNIDHAGHAGGLVTGAVFGLFVPRYTSSNSARFWRLPCWTLCLATAVSLGFAVWNNFTTRLQ